MAAKKMFLVHFELHGRAYTFKGGSCCPDNVPHTHAVEVRSLHPNVAGASGQARRELAASFGKDQHRLVGIEQVEVSPAVLAQPQGVYGIEQGPGVRHWPQ